MRFGQKGKRIILILSYLLVSALYAEAQTNMVFYPIDNQINSPNLNPAFLTSQSKYTMGIFPLTGMDVGYNNQRVIMNMLFKILNGKQTNDDFKDVFNSMVKLDLFYQRMENTIINLGYNSTIGSFDFRVKENMQIMADLKGDFSELVSMTSFQTALSGSLQSFPALTLHYREFSLGYAKEIIKEKLTLGVRAKIYYGKSSLVSEVGGALVPRSGDIYDLQTFGALNVSAPIHVSAPKDVLTSVEAAADFTMGDYLMNTKNMGTGFDLGFNYKLTSDFVISASLIDVGLIKWKNNLNTMKFKGNGTITQDPKLSLINELYKIDLDTSSPYSTRMPVTFYSGIKYRVDTRLNINLVNRLISAKSMIFNSISATGTYDVKKNLCLSTGYAIIGKSYVNMPFALLYTGSAGQYYIGTDNMLALIAPSTASFSGISFGMCFFLFKGKTKYKDQLEYLPFYKEKKKNKVAGS